MMMMELMYLSALMVKMCLLFSSFQVHGDDPSRVARAFVAIHVTDVNDNVSAF